jgi:hypothetical protein
MYGSFLQLLQLVLNRNGRFGFEPFAYKGLETGSRRVACHAVRQKDAIFVFKSR